jgi:head-tail adaptor
MIIGKLDRPILIEEPRETGRDDFNEPIYAWHQFFRGMASVLDVLSGSKEATNQDIRLTKRPVKIQMRYVPGITVAMRVTVLDRNRVLQIVTPPAEIGRKAGYEFIAEEFSS